MAYTGSAINGYIVIDGAFLAVPNSKEATELSKELMQLSKHLQNHPLTLEISDGRIEHFFTKDEELYRAFGKLTLFDSYKIITEVGISFNEACKEFINDWPAASNEGRPGVHIGIGGDPDPNSETNVPLVHLDMMAMTSSISINGYSFLVTI